MEEGPMYHMMLRAARVACASAAIVTSLLLVAGAGVVEAAANTACPAGFDVVTVEQAISEGFLSVASNVDRAGNRDGIVCRRLLGDGTKHVFGNPNVDEIYNWLDNVTPR
jgi:hypothetical protein